jgi:cytochrome bd-type quinol oxidase subunit 2
MSISGVIVIILMLATLGVLVAGLVIMARGGETNKKWSNKLMSYRVWLQAATIFALVLFVANK